jgi:isopentenyl-diphosphate delta-isomerase
VRKAAQRKLDNELGIPQDKIDPHAFQYITRIHYLAPSDGIWGEHEVDYILFLQQDIEVKPNPEEIKDTRYVTQAQLKQLIEQSKTDSTIKLTPWFGLIADSHIWKWWNGLLDGTLAQHRDGLVHHESD